MKMSQLKHLYKQTGKVEDRVAKILDKVGNGLYEKLPTELHRRLLQISDGLSALNDDLDTQMENEKNALRNIDGEQVNILGQVLASKKKEEAAVSPVAHKRPPAARKGASK